MALLLECIMLTSCWLRRSCLATRGWGALRAAAVEAKCGLPHVPLRRLGGEDAVQTHMLALGQPGQLGQSPKAIALRPLLCRVREGPCKDPSRWQTPLCSC